LLIARRRDRDDRPPAFAHRPCLPAEHSCWPPGGPGVPAERLQGGTARWSRSSLMEDEALRGAQRDGIREALVRLGLAGENPARRAAREVLTLIGPPVGQRLI